VQDLALARQRPSKDDEAVVHERVHEARMLAKALLLTQVARPVPRPAALKPNCEEHEAYLPENVLRAPCM
jgi:hypothetical protein